jgi:hypothetical protein
LLNARAEILLPDFARAAGPRSKTITDPSRVSLARAKFGLLSAYSRVAGSGDEAFVRGARSTTRSIVISAKTMRPSRLVAGCV